MSNDFAIQMNGLGKRYRLGQTVQLNRTFRETLVSIPGHFARKLRLPKATQPSGTEQNDPETPPGTFWALRDIDLEIREGETVGIIGRNGAGKSTLLKILSRITPPTKGRVALRGRVSSLLEVGTGFHPELTGRENVYLNGAILGMRRAEIRDKFDEIVAFAEVERFLDTPVKRYSSGMQVRLAFAVAAHLEPEVLIVDEVLAVGDAQFQRKCLGKMGDVARGGRTVLFVSHNMGAVGQFCARTLLLEAGRAVQFGITQDVINEYLSRFLSKSEGAAQLPPDESMDMQITHILINASDGKPRAVFAPDEEVYISIQGESRRPQRNFHIWLTLRRNGVDVLNTYDSDDYPELLDRRKTGSFSYRVRLPGGLVKSGRYTANLGVGVFGVRAIQQLPDVISFSIEEPGAGSQYLGYGPNRPGVLGKVMEWSRDDS